MMWWEFLYGLVTQYGLVGLFAASFIGSTPLIPFMTELFFPFFVRLGVNKYRLIIVATAGSLLGTWFNYLIGHRGSKFIHRRMEEEHVERVRRIMNVYGWLGLFVVIAVPLPLPVDPITILCGLGRMNPVRFTMVIITAKILRYSLFLGLFSWIF